MPSSTERRATLIAASAAVLIVIDQLTKWWAQRELIHGDRDIVWTLRLHLEYNTGSAFSLGAGRGGLIALGAIAVVGVMLWVGRAVHDRFSAAALGLVLGGAIGNLLDRAFREGNGFFGGGVVDFIDLQWWPVFNIADMGITIGGALLVFAATKAPQDGQ